MKQTPTLADIIERIRGLSPPMGGVFSYGDLFNVIGSGSGIRNKRMIKRLVKERVLHKVQRGFYVTKKPDLIILACRLKKNAYISMDSALAIHGIIGAVPEQGVSAVVPGIRRQMLETPWGNIRFFSIKRELIFGVCSMTNGARMADNEKAYLDMLYFYSRGVRFVIDPLNEVNLRKLDRKKLNRYLGRYRNSRFVKFARGLLE